ncbi:MAG TPA: hypothetical protein VFZ53_24900 [Polyangiaceae bacterium]
MSRAPSAVVVAGVFFGQAILVLGLLHFASATVVLAFGPIAGIVGAGTCLAARHARFVRPASEEPWALNAWGSVLAGFALPALGFSVGPEAAALAWLLAALHLGLGTMAIASRA